MRLMLVLAIFTNVVFGHEYLELDHIQNPFDGNQAPIMVAQTPVTEKSIVTTTEKTVAPAVNQPGGVTTKTTQITTVEQPVPPLVQPAQEKAQQVPVQAPAVVQPVVQVPVVAPVTPVVTTQPAAAQVVVATPTAPVTPIAVVPAQTVLPAASQVPTVAPVVRPSETTQPVPIATIPVSVPVQKEQPIVAPALAPQVIPEPTVQASQPPSSLPTPIAEKPVAVPEEEEKIEIEGIDTVNINEPQGNWLFKRIWWEKAERLYEKIKRLADQIAELRIVFFARRTDLDRNVLDPFYLSIGLQQGELQQAIEFFNEQMQEERKELGSLPEQERELLSRINEEKKTLEQLQLSVQGASNVDHAIDDALMKLIDQINLARQYEQKAWQYFKEINRELSDKKAREHYYAMDNAWRNLNNINSYISDAFTKYFDQLVAKINVDTEQVKSVMNALKEKGIDIKTQYQRLRKSAREMRQSREKPAQEPEVEKGWLDTIFDYIKAPFNYVWSGITGFFGWIGSWFGAAPEQVELATPSSRE